ncbi:MAG: HAMP domain-containing histidine kinase [bacterium]|nr:HAMP domain-containing histidine kinase [bacterium]
MRKRLNFVALAVTSMVALAFLVPLANLVDQLAEDRALTLAERDAQLVAQFVAATGSLTDPQAAFASVTIDGTLAGRDVTLALPGGETFGADIPAGETIDAAFAGSTLRIATDGGQAVLVPTVGPGGELAVIRVFVASEELNRGVTRSWFLLGLLSVTLVMIAVAVTDRLARSIVTPVENLGNAALSLGRGDLAARVDPDGPDEIATAGRQFNRLASDIGRLIQAERETAADLSHRLRTPLMAARLSVEQLPDPEHRAEMTRDLDDMERSIDHAIEELRRPSRVLAAGTTVFEDVVRARVAFWAPLAEDQDRTATVMVPFTATPVAVPVADLEAAIDALLGNVFAHTPEGTGYRVEVRVDGLVHMAITDDGAGFESDEATLRGRSTVGSTGLGLDIARKTAEAGGGTMTVSPGPTGGAHIQLTFQPAS